MLLKRSSLSSTNISKRSNRRLISSVQKVKPLLKIIPFLFVAALGIFILKNTLIIRSIKCSINSSICSKEVEGIFYHLVGKSYFSINKKELEWSIKQIFPLDKISYNFSYPNTLVVNVIGVQEEYSIQIAQVPQLPNLSLDIFATSTESAEWSRPIPEIERFSTSIETNPQKIWENGSLTPNTATASGRIKMFYTSIPSEEQLKNIYKLISLSHRYLEDPKIFILNDRIFLSQGNLPDIIIYIDASLSSVEASLQSIDYLSTIKKDARVLNLSFKHPIIK